MFGYVENQPRGRFENAVRDVNSRRNGQLWEPVDDVRPEPRTRLLTGR